MIEILEIKRKTITAHRSCSYWIKYKKDDIIGEQIIVCLNHLLAIAEWDSHNFEYVDRFEVRNFIYVSTNNSLSGASIVACIKYTKEEINAIIEYIKTGRDTFEKIKIVKDGRFVFLRNGDVVLPLSSAYVPKWAFPEEFYDTWLGRAVEKHSNTLNISLVDNLRKPNPVLEDLGFNFVNPFKFTCPVCTNLNSPAGQLGWPKVFYNNHREILGQINKYNDTSGKIIINDPNIVFKNLFFTEHIPFDMTYKQYCKIKDFVNASLVDYIELCKKIGKDPDIFNIKNKDQFYTLHDQVYSIYLMKQQKANEDKYQKVKSKYFDFSFEDDSFFIRFPNSLNEIIQEGNELHHCVGAYCDRIVSNIDIILFMRKKDDPNIPFVTINLRKSDNEYYCRQAHGKYNCTVNKLPGVSDFLNKWFDKFNISHNNINRTL